VLEQYVRDVRGVIGYEVPLAIDHLGHIPLEDCIKLGKRLEKYNLAWMEDALPWQMTGQWQQLHAATSVPLGTGEDIYLKESFLPLLQSGALAVVHPDVLTAGGILETKKIGDLAEDYGAQMNIHMAESPLACLAAVHVAAATRSFMALELHSVDVPWWGDLVKPALSYEGGFIKVPERPGLGIDELNEKLIRKHACADFPPPWNSTKEWDREWANDRRWS
jgi:L-alanine-DL-glutamate epimerase-like enolase superfamily enzyme